MVPFKFRDHTTMLIAGPTSCGKSTWVKRLLLNREHMFFTTPRNVLFCYGSWQEGFNELKHMDGITLHDGIPTQTVIDRLTADGKHSLLVMDDLIRDCCLSPFAMTLFTEQSHHSNMTVILISQNIFPPYKYARSVSLNCHYFIIFANRRDKVQVQVFGRQILPGQTAFFMDVYNDIMFGNRCVSGRSPYMVVDVHPFSDDTYQLRTHVFPREDTITYTPYKKGASLTTHTIDPSESEDAAWKNLSQD